MAVDFWSPSQRASSGDLSISISPLGLVELADEEFEVHGPRLNRYSACWAWYLGHHWSYRREMGEQNITLNYTRTMADYIINFCFGKGLQFQCPEANRAIIPHLLQTVWEQHNHKHHVLWEMGQLATVTGDAFVKIAYEEPFQDSLGIVHEGRIRILPLNPSSCFPEYHPHDRDRIIRFKLKYKFWGTSQEGTRQIYTFTEILTDDSVEQYINDELIDQYPNPIGMMPIIHIPNTTISSSPWGQSDIWDIIPLNRELNEKMTEVSDIVNYHCVDDQTEVLTASGWKKHTDVVDGETILTLNAATNAIQWQEATFNTFPYQGNLVKWDNRVDALTTPGHRWLVERRYGRNREYIREMARTLEPSGEERSVPNLPQGSNIVLGGGVPTQFTTVEKFADEFVDLIGWWVTEGCVTTLPSGSKISFVHQSNNANAPYVDDIRRLALYWNAEGYTFTEQRERDNGVVGWYIGTALTEMLLNVCPDKGLPPEFLTNLTYHQAERLLAVLLAADGSKDRDRDIWYQDDIGRRDGFQMLSAMLGRRTVSFENNRGDGVVNTYRKNTVMAEHTVERASEVAYDGTVWCPTVANGIWFARRNGVTYWTGNSAPVTVITGAKANQLERGAKKVWAGLPKDANVFNLESRGEMAGAMEYVSFIKRAMHEITGVPETALGQMQPISNTSGVALAIQYQPMMNRYSMKKTHFSKGLERVNEIIIRTAAVFAPELLEYSPLSSARPERDQLPVLDPRDPNIYRTSIHWPEPLPVDVLIKLNEVQAKMSLGLESKLGALRILGEEFPNEKMEEIFEELQDDAMDQGALDMVRAQIAQAVMLATGMIPGPDGSAQVASAGGSDTTSAGQGEGPLPGTQIGDAEGQMINNLVQRAYGARFAQRRVPDEE